MQPRVIIVQFISSYVDMMVANMLCIYRTFDSEVMNGLSVSNQ